MAGNRFCYSVLYAVKVCLNRLKLEQGTESNCFLRSTELIQRFCRKYVKIPLIEA